MLPDFIKEILSSPIFLVFVILALGRAMGNLNIFNISIGPAAALVFSVAFGILLSFASDKGWYTFNSSFESQMNFLSSLGSSLFISVVGINTGYGLVGSFRKKHIFFLFVGIVMTLSSFFLMKLIDIADSDIDSSLLLGIFCGSVTSTPALSAACESVSDNTFMVPVGYSISYLPAVILTVMFVQSVFGKGREQKIGVYAPKFRGKERKKNSDLILQIALSAFIGVVLGEISFPGTEFSIGSSGGFLAAGVLVGGFSGIFLRRKQYDFIEGASFRRLGLELFFIGQGLVSGGYFIGAIEWKSIFYGIILTIVPMIVGYIFTHILASKDKVDSACVLAGGMTSSPAIAVLQQRSENLDLTAYTSAYFGALVAAVLCVTI